jgi:hypothetical protein
MHKFLFRGTLLTLLATLSLAGAAFADNATDAKLRVKIIGRWFSPRHTYYYTKDGFIYWVPPKEWTPQDIRQTWDVKDGILYVDGRLEGRVLRVTKDEFTTEANGFPDTLRGHFLEEWGRAWEKKLERAAKGEQR